MTEYKRLIVGIGCREGKAVRLADDQEETFSLMEFCKSSSDNGADGLFLFDCSRSDQDHEKTIGLLKEIAREIDTPIITGGQVNRLEDVKKYLYAGASAVFLNVADEENVDLMKEAASRFGPEKIYAYLPDSGYLPKVEEYCQLGASVMILDNIIFEEKEEEAAAAKMDGCPDDVPFLLISRDPDKDGLDQDKNREMLAAQLAASNIQGVILDSPSPDHCMSMKQQLKEKGIPVETFESSISWSEFKLDQNGLMPVIVQDYKTNEVLMMAYMNEEAFHKTLESGRMTYFSRSRQKLWLKGETSGHFQYVKSLMLDCDQDTILAKVHQIGAACHTGNRSCFYRTLAAKAYKETNPLKVFEEEYVVIRDRKEHPKEGSYTNYLFDKGLDKILKKCGEEATEIIIAAKNPDPEEIKYEISDFLYHVMVLMVEKGITWEEITKEIANR